MYAEVMYNDYGEHGAKDVELPQPTPSKKTNFNVLEVSVEYGHMMFI